MIAITLLSAIVAATGIVATVRAVRTDGYGSVPTRAYTHVFDVR